MEVFHLCSVVHGVADGETTSIEGKEWRAAGALAIIESVRRSSAAGRLSESCR